MNACFPCELRELDRSPRSLALVVAQRYAPVLTHGSMLRFATMATQLLNRRRGHTALRLCLCALLGQHLALLLRLLRHLIQFGLHQ